MCGGECNGVPFCAPSARTITGMITLRVDGPLKSQPSITSVAAGKTGPTAPSRGSPSRGCARISTRRDGRVGVTRDPVSVGAKSGGGGGVAAVRQSPWGRSPDVSASLLHLSGLVANDCAGDGVHRKLVALATGALAGVPDTDCRSWCAPGTLRVAYQTGCSPGSQPFSPGRVYESRGVEGGGGLVSGVGRKCGEESSAVLLYTDVGNKNQFWEGGTASADPAVRTEGWVRGVLLKNVEGTFGCSVRSRVVAREPRVLSVRLLGRIPTLQAAATDCHWDCGGYVLWRAWRY